MSEFRVTEQQKRFFDTFGFLKFEGLVEDIILDITEGFERVFEKFGGNYNGLPHNYRRSSVIVGILGHDEVLASILDDPRVKNICSTLLGEDYNYLTSAGNKYVGSTGWHSDTKMDRKWPNNVKSINLSFILDPCTKETGALRIMPGTQFVGDEYTEKLKEVFPIYNDKKGHDPKEYFGVEWHELPYYPIETRPGDLVVFNNYLKHCTYGGGNNRRVLLVNFSQRYPEEYLDELHQYVSTFAQYFVEELHGEAVLAKPERYPHLQQVQENQGHLPELARKAKAAWLEKQKELGQA